LLDGERDAIAHVDGRRRRRIDRSTRFEGLDGKPGDGARTAEGSRNKCSAEGMQLVAKHVHGTSGDHIGLVARGEVKKVIGCRECRRREFVQAAGGHRINTDVRFVHARVLRNENDSRIRASHECFDGACSKVRNRNHRPVDSKGKPLSNAAGDA